MCSRVVSLVVNWGHSSKDESENKMAAAKGTTPVRTKVENRAEKKTK